MFSILYSASVKDVTDFKLESSWNFSCFDVVLSRFRMTVIQLLPEEDVDDSSLAHGVFTFNHY